MTADAPQPPPAPMPVRTIRRILVEAVFVALLGALALGILWEAGLADVGWIVAMIIWVAGAPLLEIIRLLQSRT